MSVVAGLRSISEMRFWKVICRIEYKFTFMLLRDFGVKTRTRTPEFYEGVQQMSEDDAVVFSELCERYNMQNIEDKYPKWLIDFYRTRTLNLIYDIKSKLRRAYAVYPTREFQYKQRRTYQDEARRGCCELYDLFMTAKMVLHGNANCYETYLRDIDELDDAIAEWAKSENRMLTRIRIDEAKRVASAEEVARRGEKPLKK